MIFQGHQVTVFTISSGSDLQLGRKKIGLVQQQGVPLVTFNAPYARDMSAGKKLLSYWRFARMVGRQGRLLPKPDLILAVSPPLTAARPALQLSDHHGVPLVLEIRELWPDEPLKRGTLRGGLPEKAARRLEHQLYSGARQIIAANEMIGTALRERAGEGAQITVLDQNINEQELINKYIAVLKKI